MESFDMARSDRIFSAEFGTWNYREFLALCVRERQTKAQYLRNLAVARTGPNRAETDAAMLFYAEKVGLSVDELKDWIVLQDARKKSAVQMESFLSTFSGDELGDIPGGSDDE